MTMDASRVNGKRVSVIGAARSGLAIAKLAGRNGAAVFVSDSAPAEKMREAAEELNRNGIECEFGGNSRRILDADLIVLSPGVRSDQPIVREAREAGLPIVSELEAASWFCSAPIIAVTGTNGKTTTTSLIGQTFEDAGKPCAVGGNIGTAFSQIVTTMTEGSTAVLEVSSFQLDETVTFRPRVAVLLNITPDHLDRYGGSFERYIDSKCRVFMNQGSGDSIIYSYDDPIVRPNVEARARPSVRRLPFSSGTRLRQGAFVEDRQLKAVIEDRTWNVIPIGEIGIRGGHNLYNAMAAALASLVMGIPEHSLASTLSRFRGVEHRLEFVREREGVTYVNDSKATNVDSVWYALQSFSSPIILLLGGRDKGNDYTRLFPLVRSSVRAVVAIGESADKVVSAFSPLAVVRKALSMEEAVRTGAALAQKGDVVLLSPACASFDWFTNYEERGRVFKEQVLAL
jgi:UDP-N-acetylmuramoylalanine--D-glutamate ligase